MSQDMIRDLMVKELELRLDAAWNRAGSIDGARCEISHAQVVAKQLIAEFSRIDAKIEAIRAEALREAADRAVVFAIDEGWICSSKTADRFRAAILAGEVKE